jgi:hypothetical protein
MLEEKNVTAVDWLVKWFELGDAKYYSKEYIKNRINEAKAMEKEQIKDAFVECYKANAPDGFECKLDAEQYYVETYEK